MKTKRKLQNEIERFIYSSDGNEFIELDIDRADYPKIEKLVKELFTLNILNQAIDDYEFALNHFKEEVCLTEDTDVNIRTGYLRNGLCNYFDCKFDIDYASTGALLGLFNHRKIKGSHYVFKCGYAEPRLQFLINVRKEFYDVS